MVDEERETRRAGWRLMRDAVRPLKVLVWMGILAGLVWTGARVAIPALTGAAIDDGIVPGNFDVALKWTLIILAVGVIQAICTGLRRYAAFRLAFRVETDLRMRLVAHLQRLHFAFHDHAQTGQLMANANTDIQQIHLVVLLIPLTIASVLTMIAVAIVLTLRSPGLALFALAALPLLNIAATRFTRRMHPVAMALQEELAELSGVVEESVSGVRVVKGFGAERLQKRNLAREADDVYERSLDQARLRANFLPLIDLLPTLGLVGILWYGGHQVLDGNLSIGTIVEANFYVLMLIWPLADGRHAPRPAARARPRPPAASTACSRPSPPSRTMRRPGRSRPGPDGSSSTASGSATEAPARCSTASTWMFAAVEAIALVGATASGKTTVGASHPRFYDVTEGSVRHRRHRRARGRAARRPPGGRHRLRRHVPLLRHRAQQHRVRGSRGNRTNRSCGRRGSPVPTSSYEVSPTDTRPSSASTGIRSPVVNVSASPSRAPCSQTRAS